ncbi:MAG: cysteine synthase [Desulfovibrionaceae bacterium]|nr:cysteine synthase [Desulfovibrionaceae bacterium]
MAQRDVLGLVGGTPLVEIRRLNPRPGVKILAKLESFNPGGSIKDRVALAMVEAAEQSGELTPDKTVIEATSGNTGIGLAMVCAVRGYRCRLIMSENASEERKMILRAYGAEIRLTPGRMGTDGAIEEAYRLAREAPDKYVLMDQYNNPACVQAHYLGTAREIWDQTGGALTHAVAAMGTTGTAMGLAKGLKERGQVFVAGVEPYAGHGIQGLKNMHESYPPGIYDKSALDAVLRVDDQEAFELCRRLAREEGLLAGMSSGAALAGALKLASDLDTGLVVVIFPDSGERYLSTPLFAAKDERGVRLFSVDKAARTGLSPGPAGAGLYTVGPGLDDPGDLGAWRRVALLDVLARYRESRGLASEVAVGLADLDDRAISAARRAQRPRAEFVSDALAAIRRRAGLLGLRPRTRFALASESVFTCLELCRRLLAKGLAYEKLRSVYFDVLRDARYGEIRHMDVDKISLGKTVDLAAYVKDNPRDFTLLKRASLLDLKQGEVLDTEWGNVRPSWFLQLAAAGLDALPEISLFLAAEAHQFPHLENLRAIWSSAGTEVSAWLVGQPVTGGENLDIDRALEAAESGLALRMWLLSAHYRKPLAAGDQGLAMWARNWRRLQDLAGALGLAAGAPGGEIPAEVEQAVFDLKTGLAQSVEDDLGLHHFWPVLFGFAKKVNAWLGPGRLSGAAAKTCLKQLQAVDRVLVFLDPDVLPVPGDDLPQEVRAMVQDRERARLARDFAASDGLRERISKAGFRVEDSPAGPRVYRV